MKVKEIKGNMESVDVLVRIIQVLPTRTVRTKRGEEKKIQELIAGDETGRIKVVLWENFGNFKQNDVIKIENGWTTVFKDQIELNAGKRSRVIIASDSSIPPIEKIPNTVQSIGEYRIPLKRKE